MKYNTNTQPIQELEFLTVTVLPQGARGHDEESRRIVRSHAIRDSNRRKRLSPLHDNEQLHETPISIPRPQSNFTSRFRLDKKSKNKADSAQNKEVDEMLKSTSKHVTTLDRQKLQVQRSFGFNLFDPFDTLPSGIGPRARAFVESRKSLLNPN